MHSTADKQKVIPVQRLNGEHLSPLPAVKSPKNAPDITSSPDSTEHDAFRTFTYAVLAKHWPVHTAYCGTAMCVCGCPLVLCDYTRLAKEILSSESEEIPSLPAPERPSTTQLSTMDSSGNETSPVAK